MASSARIDELRKKFDENPRRYFAPLANEYRKAGELEQAISICREYLPQQPGHMSGHIVYGQALFEHSRFDESRHVFETALSLDPENLIALRHLGDIARQAGDTRAARGWYQRVLEADPRNEEIAALMSSLLAPSRRSQPAINTIEADFAPAKGFIVPHEPDSSVDKSQDLAVGSELSGAHEVHDLGDVTIPGVPLSGLSGSPSMAHAEDAGGSALSESSSANANDTVAPPPVDLEFIAALAAMSDDRAEPTPEIARTESPSSDEATVPIVLESPRGLDPFEHGVTPPPIAVETPDVAFDAYFATSAEKPATVEASSTPALTVDPMQGPPMSEAFVTETMADVYLQQGHLDSALEIYKKLVSQRPDDTRLQHRLRVIGEQIQRRAETPSATEGRVTEGLTIRQFLVGLIALGPASAAGSTTQGQRATQDADRPQDRTAAPLSNQSLEHLKVPTPVAQIASIDEDFGSTVPVSETAIDLESAEAAVEAFRVTLPTSELASGVDNVVKTGKATRAKSAGDAYAFDRFLAADSSDGSAKSGAKPQTSPRQGADDIAQFTNWLNGLKKT